MRVVAGRWGGRRLVAPAGRDTRPTLDRVREALFGALDSRGVVEGARVLDLFAGSGALAIEALSRGAASAVLVDSDAAAIKAIKANLTALDATADVRRADVRAALRRARGEGEQYDLVFLDPPYRLAAGLGLTEALVPLLTAGSLVVAESDKRAAIPLELPLLDERRYGDTLIRTHASR